MRKGLWYAVAAVPVVALAVSLTHHPYDHPPRLYDMTIEQVKVMYGEPEREWVDHRIRVRKVTYRCQGFTWEIVFDESGKFMYYSEIPD